jgi:hypothetical protein
MAEVHVVRHKVLVEGWSSRQGGARAGGLAQHGEAIPGAVGAGAGGGSAARSWTRGALHSSRFAARSFYARTRVEGKAPFAPPRSSSARLSCQPTSIGPF